MNRSIFIIIILFFSSLLCLGQKKDVFVVTGKVVLERDVDQEITISAICVGTNDIYAKKYLKSKEPFSLKFEFNKEYLIEFSSENFYKKSIGIDTHIDAVVMNRLGEIAPFSMMVTLFQEVEGIDDSFTQKPVGKIYFDDYITGFTADVFTQDFDIEKYISTEKKKMEQEFAIKTKKQSSKANSKERVLEVRSSWSKYQNDKSYSELVFSADSLYGKKMYNLARFYYVKALNKAKDNSYCLGSINKCQKKVDQELRNIRVLEVKALIDLGDSLFSLEKYCRARFIYNKAHLKVPMDRSISQKIDHCNQLINQ
ncbi:hypothetical protein K4L44_07020 [Halosquirtibacter laminarini]|uniref:Uncharacterized protein n=1 Tax=Halosquirtibacter laminarini TaxID=3374600 RepID=A0AC61NJ69_9BACT|nr:hypothetical protein K4L44_07020 [Prolixibacteraceae bacterium]